MKRWTKAATIATLAATMLPGLSSCFFTGVESTPRITERDIKKRKITQTAEQQLLGDVKGEKPGTWKAGKEFYITDDRISLIFTPSVDGSAEKVPDSLGGTVLTLTGVSSTPSITGEENVQLDFRSAGGEKLVYRPGTSLEAFMASETCKVPFTVELSVVEEVNTLLAGNTYYILPARRLDKDGKETTGLRYQAVTIESVLPGNQVQPLTVVFKDENGETGMVNMTYGGESTSMKNFDTLFSLSDPRKRYPDIGDKTWDKIMRSEIEVGMTPEECRLALGAPNDYLRVPTTMGMSERWTYDNGVYLYFEDGMLKTYRR